MVDFISATYFKNTYIMTFIQKAFYKQPNVFLQSNRNFIILSKLFYLYFFSVTWAIFIEVRPLGGRSTFGNLVMLDINRLL